MAEFLLIHGAGFGAWCWPQTIAALHSLGHTARAIDLPGRGRPASMAEQTAAILAALPPLVPSKPAILVGHSAGGFAITAAAEAVPDRWLGLIYLCAYVPSPGRTLAQMRRAGPSQPLAPALRPDRAAGLFRFDPALCRDLFFHDCADATPQLCPQAIAPMETALPSTARAEALPRAAIFCDDDHAIPPQYQRDMAHSIDRQISLPCGHAPFLALPQRLAHSLSDLARDLVGMG